MKLFDGLGFYCKVSNHRNQIGNSINECLFHHEFRSGSPTKIVTRNARVNFHLELPLNKLGWVIDLQLDS